MSVFWTLGGGLGSWFSVYNPVSTFVRQAPALTLDERVFLSLSPHTCTSCTMFSLDPSVVGLAPPCTCSRKDRMTQLCACHMIGKELVFFSFLYIKLFEIGVEVAFNNRSAVTHHKVNLLKFPLWSSSFEHIDDVFVLLNFFCFLHL